EPRPAGRRGAVASRRADSIAQRVQPVRHQGARGRRGRRRQAARVQPVAGARAGDHQHVRRGRPHADGLGAGDEDRPDPRHHPPLPHHARRARLRRDGRPHVPVDPARAGPGLLVPVGPGLPRRGPPPSRAPRRRGGRVQRGVRARRRGHRLRRARARDEAHDDRDQRRLADARARDLDGEGAARRPAGRRAGGLSARCAPHAIPGQDHHGARRAARGGPPGAPGRLRDRRPGARGGPARRGGARARPGRPGRRRGEPLHPCRAAHRRLRAGGARAAAAADGTAHRARPGKHDL
ncbi:MAG: Transcriptional regulator, IclR family, partial [uncultured Solirubrobacteraceae bacterium]